nr:MAG TPA: hypothetical protein [Caudoviricetes sp.]
MICKDFLQIAGSFLYLYFLLYSTQPCGKVENAVRLHLCAIL